MKAGAHIFWARSGRIVALVYLLIGGTAWAQDGQDEPSADDAAAYYEIVETAVTPAQIAEMAAGIGPMGIKTREGAACQACRARGRCKIVM